MAELINDGGKASWDLYVAEKRRVAQQFSDFAFHGAIVLSDEGNYWIYTAPYGLGYWDKLSSFWVWWYKLIGKI